MPRVKTEAKERAILDAAAKVFATKPFHGVLIDEIASDAGIGKGTIYRYFETKDDLYFATTLHVLDRLAKVLSEALAQERSAAKRLERIALESLRFYWDRRFLFPFLEADGLPGRREELLKRREAILRFAQETILSGIERRELRGIDARIGAELFLGLVRSANLFRRPEDTLDDLVKQILSVFLEGVTRREP
jgi:TetR/AcrR family fatty acid metabolism transcriptional regulator